MPPIQTSQDVLMYALSCTVIIIGLLLAWSLYYLALSLRDTRRITSDVRERVEAFWEVVELAREKLQVGGAVFKIAATGIKELADHMRAQSQENTNKKSKRSKKK